MPCEALAKQGYGLSILVVRGQPDLTARKLPLLTREALRRLGGEQIRQLAVAGPRLGSDGARGAALLLGGPPGIVTKVRFHSVASPSESGLNIG
jgi:hypothetical protein